MGSGRTKIENTKDTCIRTYIRKGEHTHYIPIYIITTWTICEKCLRSSSSSDRDLTLLGKRMTNRKKYCSLFIIITISSWSYLLRDESGEWRRKQDDHMLSWWKEAVTDEETFFSSLISWSLIHIFFSTLPTFSSHSFLTHPWTYRRFV